MSALVPQVAPMSRAQIEADAVEITRLCYPNLADRIEPFPIVRFFDFELESRFKLQSGVAELGPGVEGMTFPDGRVFVTEETYRSAVRNNGRGRMTLAHESYHGIRHCRQLQQQLIHPAGRVVLARRSSLPPYLNPEWQANYFAAALLMPAHAVKRLSRESSSPEDLLHQITTRLLVSRQAAEIRVSQLGI